MTGRKIVALAGDPGGGAALFPVLQTLRSAGASLDIFAYGESLKNWAAKGLPCTALPDGATADPAPFMDGAALLLTGTSCNSVNAERVFWQYAGRQGIPSLAVLDFWSNYRERFLIGEEPFWPTRVAVMDECAAQALAEAGCPRESIAITGHPGLDALADATATPGPTALSALRCSLGAGKDQPLVIFVSQPLRSLNQDLGKATAFDELTVLASVVDALGSRTGDGGPTPRLVIRPHPREAAGKFDGFNSRGLGFAIDAATPPHHLLQAADLVLGMNSMLLLEACLLGRPVVSIQPGGDPTRDPLPTNGFGASQAIYRPEDILPVLGGLIGSPEKRAALARQASRFRPRPGATARVSALANELAR